jgi:hypothetical protein
MTATAKSPSQSPSPAVAAASPRDPRFALGQSVGLAAFVWGYPLVETFRTCRLQTLAKDSDAVAWRADFDRVQHVQRASTAADRDVVTPANDLLYTTGWINLANGPRLLHVPSSQKHGGRYFVLALYDAWTNNFENPGSRTSPPQGETVMLLGPTAPMYVALPAGARVVRSPTDLVWLIARVVVGQTDAIEGEGDTDSESNADARAARALQADIRLECPAGTDSGRHPLAVQNWLGAPQDTMAALLERPEDSEAIAGTFFTNLCQCLTDAPPMLEDTGLAAWFTRGKLVPGRAFDWAWLDAPLRDGLLQGLLDAAALLVSGSRSHTARPWAASFSVGRFGHNTLARALTAYKGLGGLASDEAVYAMGDFDADKQPLHGGTRYVMRFEPGDLPPVDAFWSVTMYDADRFLYPNPMGRYAIGDRTPGLQRDPDGGLSMMVAHQRPNNPANWLPAPAGSFYLILRMYCPRPEARAWRIPPLQRVADPVDA